jgi:RNA polymerase sigma-70 factor, ECF subfamily
MTGVGGPRRPDTSPSSRFESELARHASSLRAAAVALCRNSCECEDLIQDTFERALRYMVGRETPVRNMRAWLVTILRNAFIDRVRAERATSPGIDDCPAAEPDPEPPWADVTLADVQSALAVIDSDLREVFELHYLQGMRYRDIAARLAVPENTVASRLFRARRALRDQLLVSSNEGSHGEERVRTER